MPDNFNIEVKINLPSLEPKALNRAIRKALLASVIHLEGAAKDNITPFTRTGRLRSSIQHRVRGSGIAGVFGATVGTRVVYAKAVEYGWGEGMPNSNPRLRGSFAGHHYMRKTAREQKNRVVKIFKDHINKAL